MTKEERKEYNRQYRLKNKERIAERTKQWYEDNKQRLAEQMKQYYQDNKEAITEQKKQYYQENKDRILEQRKQYHSENKEHIAQYYQENKERLSEYRKQYNSTKEGRAENMSRNYKSLDQQKGFSTDQNITQKWILENIFTSKCVYCGDDDWEHLGADRIDNDKPHTPDNVVCACGICNAERSDKYSVEDFKEYRKLHPRDLSNPSLANYETAILPNGLKVLKKK